MKLHPKRSKMPLTVSRSSHQELFEQNEVQYPPNAYHKRFNTLEDNWTEMTNAKFLSEAQKCETLNAWSETQEGKGQAQVQSQTEQ